MMEARESTGIAAGSPGEDEAAADTARLRDNIAETRESIGETIEALQEKLSPRAIAQQAKTAVREATIGKVEDMVEQTEEKITRTGQSIYERIRHNPLPFALAGVGLAWLFLGGRDGGQRGDGRIVTRVKSAAHDVASKAERVAKEDVPEAARSAADTVKRVAREAEDTGRRVEGRVERMFHDSPIAVGAIAMAAGTAVGLAIPISRREEEWMGPARDRLVDRASEMAHEALGKAEGAAHQSM